MSKVAVFLVDEFEDVVGAILTSFLVLILFYNVVLRYCFGQTMPTSEELARILFIWVVFVTAAGSARNGGHYRVSVHLNIMPLAVRRYLLAFSDLIWVGFCLFTVYYGVKLVASMFEYPYISPSLQLNYAYVYIIIPISFALMSVRVVGRRIKEFKSEEIEGKAVVID
jgi:C4-dicarboxylate transporter DctM subunit